MGFKGFKDFESVRIKATYNIEIGNRIIKAGETIAFFDKIQASGFDEFVKTTRARGGYANKTRVIWEEVNEMKIYFSRGIFSESQFAIMANAQLIETNDVRIYISKREELESDQDGVISCKHIPIKNIYVYERKTGNKLDFIQNEDKLQIDTSYTEVIVDYEFIYQSKAKSVRFGDALFNNFVSIEGITRIKDDETGIVTTGLIRIPKVKITTHMNMRLGPNANPVVPSLKAIAIPVGERHSEYVCEFIILDEDIEADF